MEKLQWNQAGQSEPSFEPTALEQAKVDTFNAAQGDLTGYSCQKCLNKGVIARLGENGRLAVRDCACQTIRRSIRAMERSGLKGIIQDMTFEAFQTQQSWQKTLLEGVRAYAEDPQGWLLLCGQVGSGKTHLCTAVCRQRLYAGDEVRYMPWREDVTRLKALATELAARNELMEGLKKAKILYIDDLYKSGKGCEPTSADVAIAFELLNYRYINRLTTIVSSEYSPQQLVAIDEATGSRIVEMAGVNTYHIGNDPTRNYRMRGVRKL